MPKTSWIHVAIMMQYRHMTDRHRAIANTRAASIVSHGQNQQLSRMLSVIRVQSVAAVRCSNLFARETPSKVVFRHEMRRGCKDCIAAGWEIGRTVTGTINGWHGTTASATWCADLWHRLVMRRQVHCTAASLGNHCHNVAATGAWLQLCCTATHVK